MTTNIIQTVKKVWKGFVRSPVCCVTGSAHFEN